MIALVGMGLLSLALVLMKSGTPSARAKANVPSFPVEELAVGNHKELEFPDHSILAFRVREKDYFLYRIIRWSYNGTDEFLIYPGWHQCRSIRADVSTISCIGNEYVKLRWNLDGTPVDRSASWVPKLEAIPYRVSAGMVRYGPGA